MVREEPRLESSTLETEILKSADLQIMARPRGRPWGRVEAAEELGGAKGGRKLGAPPQAPHSPMAFWQLKIDLLA